MHVLVKHKRKILIFLLTAICAKCLWAHYYQLIVYSSYNV